jgi:hypothetical protein
MYLKTQRMDGWRAGEREGGRERERKEEQGGRQREGGRGRGNLFGGHPHDIRQRVEL